MKVWQQRAAKHPRNNSLRFLLGGKISLEEHATELAWWSSSDGTTWAALNFVVSIGLMGLASPSQGKMLWMHKQSCFSLPSLPKPPVCSSVGAANGDQHTPAICWNMQELVSRNTTGKWDLLSCGKELGDVSCICRSSTGLSTSLNKTSHFLLPLFFLLLLGTPAYQLLK